MTTSFAATKAEHAEASAFIEKRPLERYLAPAQPSLVGLSRDDLADALGTLGVAERQRRMRVQQIWQWLYVRGAQDFAEMTTLSKDLRTALAQRFTLARPEIAAEQISVDGTRKWLLRLPGELAGPVRSSASTSLRPTAARCAFPVRSAARSIARSAIPARSAWSVI
jgi:hypothetical protein